jgi:hypothetical protein
LGWPPTQTHLLLLLRLLLLLPLQVRAADVVVLNKCDLASLAAMAGVEDALQALAPGVRMLRARFGQVGCCCCCYSRTEALCVAFIISADLCLPQLLCLTDFVNPQT